jgi:RNA polymerase sigma-70 factor (ECF subfamily)
VRDRSGNLLPRSRFIASIALKIGGRDHPGILKLTGVSSASNRKSVVDPVPDDETTPASTATTAAPVALEADAPSDVELMSGVQAGDPDALSDLYDRYNGILKALILRVVHNEAEADDLLQEVFMEIWNQAKNFSAAKGKPLGWMVTLARRRAIDGLRKKQSYARAEERLQTEPEQQPTAWVQNITEQEIRAGDTRALMAKVINSLPEPQQQAIELAFFQGMSQREIAANTNTPLGTVKTRLELGLKKIYDGLKELEHEL